MSLSRRYQAGRFASKSMEAGKRAFAVAENCRILASTKSSCSAVALPLVRASLRPARQFLVDHVERVIYNRYNVTIVGSVPVQSASGEAKLQFRIEGKIDNRGDNCWVE
jgi:hypothetical protein